MVLKILPLAFTVIWNSFCLLIQLFSVHLEIISIKEPPVLCNLVINFPFPTLSHSIALGLEFEFKSYTKQSAIFNMTFSVLDFSCSLCKLVLELYCQNSEKLHISYCEIYCSVLFKYVEPIFVCSVVYK